MKHRIIYLILTISLILPSNYVFAIKQDTTKVNNEIKDKTALVNSLTEKIHVYEENIRKKREEQSNLQNEVDILDNTIAKTETEIDKTETEISRLNSEIQLVTTKIEETESNVNNKQKQISSYIFDLYQSEQKTNLEVLLNNTSLSDYFSFIEYSDSLREEVQKNVDQLKILKNQLKEQKVELDTKKVDETDKKQTLEIQKNNFDGEKTFKNSLLEQVEGDEAKFQELLKKVKSEQDVVEAQIATLESQMRTKIETPNSGINDTTFVMPTDFKPDWPVTSRRITCGFHCLDYFAGYTHSGMDIGISQGSPVYSADTGIVTIARSTGTTAFNYILISHANGFATMYGHLTEIYVQPDQKAIKGELIGLSGGMPGTIGSGWLTTGPHLHFEVRLNGIAVNPANYLP